MPIPENANSVMFVRPILYRYGDAGESPSRDSFSAHSITRIGRCDGRTAMNFDERPCPLSRRIRDTTDRVFDERSTRSPAGAKITEQCVDPCWSKGHAVPARGSPDARLYAPASAPCARRSVRLSRLNAGSPAVMIRYTSRRSV